MGKNFVIKISMGKAPNEMGNCPFVPPPLVAPLIGEKYEYSNEDSILSIVPFHIQIKYRKLQ
jgi:hypothetical protein